MNQDNSSGNDMFELEFTRETSISHYYIWFEGYLEACKILNLDTELPKKTFGIYKEGKVRGYTQENNIKIMKKAINNLDFIELKKLIDIYKEEFIELKEHKMTKDKNFLKKIISKFVIVFILGDMVNHPLQEEALAARIFTEKLFYLLPHDIYIKENSESKMAILTRDKIILVNSSDDINRFLIDSKISLSKDF
jgi:hypothetical protein